MHTYTLIQDNHYGTLLWYRKMTVNDLPFACYPHDEMIAKYGTIYVNRNTGWRTMSPDGKSVILSEIQAEEFPVSHRNERR